VRLPDALPAAGPRQATPPARVDSEVGRLRSVLVHRPGDELRAIDRRNAARMLFAGPVDLAQAQTQHDAFTAALRADGVEVLYVEELLAQVAARRPDALLDAAASALPARVRRRFALLAPDRLARALIGGAWLLRPLPNLLYTRDPSVRLGKRALIGAMATEVRRREAALMTALHRLHPKLASTAEAPPGVEGGDVIVAGPGRVIVGISPRTTTASAHRLASNLLLQRAATEVITIELPPGAGVHLDLLLSMVDYDTFAVWAPARRALRAHRWLATTRGVSVCAVADPLADRRVVEIGSRAREPHGREWDRGVNVLALAPNRVLAYADNGRANEELTDAGVDVIAVDGAALATGRGGPRCLSCPLDRAAA
jgi:arginine deiminase